LVQKHNLRLFVAVLPQLAPKMAAHAALIAETIAGMQQVINKQQYCEWTPHPTFGDV